MELAITFTSSGERVLPSGEQSVASGEDALTSGEDAVASCEMPVAPRDGARADGSIPPSSSSSTPPANETKVRSVAPVRPSLDPRFVVMAVLVVVVALSAIVLATR
jgi:hypothetical protein